MKGLWVNWNYKEESGSYPTFNEVYLNFSWCKKIPDIKEISQYITKCRNNFHKVYITVTCFADLDTKRTMLDIKQDIKVYSKVADGISLDYIRYKNMSLSNLFNTDRIIEVLEYTKQHTNRIKIAVFPFYNSFMYGQNYFQLQKYGTLQPMLYAQDMFGRTTYQTQKWTRWIIRISNLLFPKSEPCLQGWNEPLKNNNRTMIDLIYDKKLVNNYSVFRWNTYKKL